MATGNLLHTFPLSLPFFICFPLLGCFNQLHWTLLYSPNILLSLSALWVLLLSFLLIMLSPLCVNVHDLQISHTPDIFLFQKILPIHGQTRSISDFSLFFFLLLWNCTFTPFKIILCPILVFFLMFFQFDWVNSKMYCIYVFLLSNF